VRRAPAEAVSRRETASPGETGDDRLPVVVLCAVLAIYLAGSWFPFRLELPRVVDNGLSVAGDGAWVFEDVGLALTEAPPSWLQVATSSERLEVRLEVRPASSTLSGPARIMALSATSAGGRDVAEQNLMVGQEGRDLVVRVRRPGADELGEPAVVIPEALVGGQWRELIIVLGSSIDIAVDGVVLASEAAEGWPATWDADAVLTLGNTPSGTRPWQGELRSASVTVDSEERDLLDDAELTVPERVAVVPSRLREPRDRPLGREVAVGLGHVLVGAALAVALSGVRPAWSSRRVVGSVAVLSVIANAGKVVVATRHPSLLTTALQIVGAVVALSSGWPRRWHQSMASPRPAQRLPRRASPRGRGGGSRRRSRG
jgi:hypothetical protein